uniref:ACYPI008667 protein n=1 Tax=Acyrthosiphon pisum TaxID=7029 RepID=I6QHT4_ACYPI|nr:hypothetical protein [Acyrthosiphon pisum]
MPMFAFMILLNFFFLYSPIESAMNGETYDTCQKCLADTCHKQYYRPCIFRNGGFFCFTCHSNNRSKFYTEAGCQKICTDPGRLCVCVDACYECVTKGVRTNPESCKEPTNDELSKCK